MPRVASLAAAAGMLWSLTAFAGPYDGHRIVRVWPASAREQLAVSQLPMQLAGEAVLRDGGTPYIADAAATDMLRTLGVRFEVVVEDVQALVDAQEARLDARERWGVGPGLRGDADAFFQEFRDINELNAFFDELLTAYPGLISREQIGTSIQGRPIHAYTIAGPGDEDARPSLIFNGTAHAREWISPMTVSYIMHKLAEGYGTVDEVTALLDHVTFRIAPIMNPDGYVYSWSTERFWRKTRRNNGNGTFGVDWNRNFATGWGGPGASSDPGDDTYRGVAPFSEPETQALRDYTLGIPNRAFHIDFHSFSQLVLWPWGYTNSEIPEPDRTIHETIATAYAQDMISSGGVAYSPIKSSDLYLASGDSSDWSYGAGGVYSLTVELRPADGSFDGFDPPPTTILPCAQENFAAVLGLAQTVASGVTASFVGGEPEVVEPNTEAPVLVDIAPAFSGPLDTSSALLWARVGNGAFQPSPMSLSGSAYLGSLPPAPCGSTIEYYIQIDSLAGTTYSIPFDAPTGLFTAQALETALAFEDDMETNLGWTVGAPGDSATTGIWERVNPQGTAAQPEDDHTPSGTLCWVTGGSAGTGVGSFDIDGGVTTLISPTFDATEPGAEVSYWLWYSNDQGSAPGEDSFLVRVSNDGGASWTLAQTITSSTNQWVRQRFTVADFVTPTANTRVRFEASDLFNGSVVEAAVDDFTVASVGCPGNPADIAPPFGVLDLADIQAFIAGFNAADPIADIAPPFGVLDLADIQAFVDAFVNGIP